MLATAPYPIICLSAIPLIIRYATKARHLRAGVEVLSHWMAQMCCNSRDLGSILRTLAPAPHPPHSAPQQSPHQPPPPPDATAPALVARGLSVSSPPNSRTAPPSDPPSQASPSPFASQSSHRCLLLVQIGPVSLSCLLVRQYYFAAVEQIPWKVSV